MPSIGSLCTSTTCVHYVAIYVAFVRTCASSVRETTLTLKMAASHCDPHSQVALQKKAIREHTQTAYKRPNLNADIYSYTPYIKGNLLDERNAAS